MDMSLREWLILIGVVIIAGVVVDGYRRMRLAKKRSSELSFGLEDVKGSEEGFGSELPNGGARRKNRSLAESDHIGLDDRVEPGFSAIDPEDGMSSRPEYSFSDNQELDVQPQPVSEVHPDNKRQTEESRPAQPAPVDDVQAKDSPDSEEPVPVLMDLDQKPGKVAKPVKKKVEPLNESKARPVRTKPAEKKAVREKLSERPPASEVIVINVLAKNGENFDGPGLFQFLTTSGMSYGDMGIFHRHTNSDGSGKVLFSMANGVEPGCFNIDKLEETQTPIVSFFMGMPGPEKPLQAFTLMEETAQRMALDLGGELKDEQLSVMTQQTLEHCRQRIREYERKQLATKVPN